MSRSIMRIFLTGATGYIGSAVLDACLRAGHEVTALVRHPSKGERLRARGVGVCAGELADSAWQTVAATHDALVHTAFESSPKGPQQDRAALEALLAAAGRYHEQQRALIYTSGVWVIGPAHAPADETHQVRPLALAEWRVPHEKLVLDAAGPGLRTVVIRPGVVYGGGRGIIGDLFRDGANGLIRVVGDGRNRWATIYDRDLADLYVRILASPDASGLFHATDDGDDRVIDMVEAIGRNQKIAADVRHVPLEEARAKMGPYADALAVDQVVRSPRARALGWLPTLGSVSRNVPRLIEEWRTARGE